MLYGDLFQVNLVQTVARLREVPTLPQPFTSLYVIQDNSPTAVTQMFF